MLLELVLFLFWLILTLSDITLCLYGPPFISPPKTPYKVRHGLMLLWFTDLMNVTEEVTIHRPNISTLLSSAFIRGDLNAAIRGPSI